METEKGVPKPNPPPKPFQIVGYRGSVTGGSSSSTSGCPAHMSPEMFNQLRQLKSKTKDLKTECANLRRMAKNQSQATRDTLRETCSKIKGSIAFLNSNDPIEKKLRMDRLRLSRDEDSYRSDVMRLEKDLSDLESRVEELRSNVINRMCRVNMIDVEEMAFVLSRASKAVFELKLRYPHLQDTLKTVMQQEMEVVVREEKYVLILWFIMCH